MPPLLLPSHLPVCEGSQWPRSSRQQKSLHHLVQLQTARPSSRTMQRECNQLLIDKPLFIGDNDYEARHHQIFFSAMGKSQSLLNWAILNSKTFTCLVGDSAPHCTLNQSSVWRYLYFGEFPNLRLTKNPSSGAWHNSEITNVFGTAEEAGLPDTDSEKAMSEYMMGAWAAFAKNPTVAVSQPPYSWPKYHSRGK